MCRTAPGPQCLLPACLNHDGISSLPQTSVRSAFRGAQTSLTVPIIRLVLKVTDSWREGACFPLRLEEAPLRLEHAHNPRQQPGVWGLSRRSIPRGAEVLPQETSQPPGPPASNQNTAPPRQDMNPGTYRLGPRLFWVGGHLSRF